MRNNFQYGEMAMPKNKKCLPTRSVTTREYAETLTMLKKRIQEAQVKAALTVNKELIKLYWAMGKTIIEKQETAGWGAGIIEQLAQDLQNAFPGVAGFSRLNIFRIQAFYRAYEKVSQAVTQLENLPIFSIPWGHNIVLIHKIKNQDDRLWYAQKAVENGWSRSMLETWIKSKLHRRQGKAITNFSRTLPAPQSDMAQQSLKDPYIFDFLTLQEEHLERDIEQALINHVQKFLLELGKDFAFVGRQYHIEVDEEDYYLDLLFYHLKLRCYAVIELKNTAFKPEYAGKLNFYLSAVDDLLRHKDDNPTIGLLLCKTKKNFTVEYALRDVNKPIGVAEYETKLVASLPKNLKSSLPTIQEIEAELWKPEVVTKIKAKKVIKRTRKK
jgi:predicted nuclease of restriction endonuclease-like (RecB) superfamily